MASPAPTCRAALDEATRRWPTRSKASDGIMGDARHCAKPGSTSDHCTGNAFDLTHDPAHGCDAHALVEQLRQRQDPRVKYIISRRRIWNPLIGAPAAYRALRAEGHGRSRAALSALPGWRRYTGSNPHDKHAHVSTKPGSRSDLRAWWASAPLPPPPPPPQEDDMAKYVRFNRSRTVFEVRGPSMEPVASEEHLRYITNGRLYDAVEVHELGKSGLTWLPVQFAKPDNVLARTTPTDYLRSVGDLPK